MQNSNRSGVLTLEPTDRGGSLESDSLRETIAFFRRLSKHTSDSWPGSFTDQFLLVAVDLLSRVGRGDRVSEDAWIAAFEDIGLIPKCSEGRG
jgi:hypothetical protein